MKSRPPSRRVLATSVAALIGLTGVLKVGAAAEADTSSLSLIPRVIAQTTRSGIAVRAIRHLYAGTRSGKHLGWMEVATAASPSGTFDWRVLAEGGSERTREKVFRAVLEAEADAWQPGTQARSALSTANYQFIPEEAAPGGHVRIRLKPRRADATLVNGTLTVSPDGHPLLLEGHLSKSPSFWVKSVSIVKRYERFAGVSLPVVIESVADVKMLGPSTFSMRYSYLEVNGRSVTNVAAATPVARRASDILVLHPTLRGAREPD